MYDLILGVTSPWHHSNLSNVKFDCKCITTQQNMKMSGYLTWNSVLDMNSLSPLTDIETVITLAEIMVFVCWQYTQCADDPH